jgi:hypothetical protein
LASEEVLEKRGWKSKGGDVFRHPKKPREQIHLNNQGGFEHFGRGFKTLEKGPHSKLAGYLKSGQDFNILGHAGLPGGHAGYGQ